MKYTENEREKVKELGEGSERDDIKKEKKETLARQTKTEIKVYYSG